MKLPVKHGFTVVGVIDARFAVSACKQVVAYGEREVMHDNFRLLVFLQIGLMQSGGQASAGRDGRPGQVTTARVRFQRGILADKVIILRDAAFDKINSVVDHLLLDADVGRGRTA